MCFAEDADRYPHWDGCRLVDAVVAAELISATRGLGFMVQSAGELMATHALLVGIGVIAIIVLD